jgi:hypothetical protein
LSKKLRRRSQPKSRKQNNEAAANVSIKTFTSHSMISWLGENVQVLRLCTKSKHTNGTVPRAKRPDGTLKEPTTRI